MLESIFVGTEDSLFQLSKRFFHRLDIDLRITEPARRLIAYRASLQPRIGARALKDIYSRVIKPFEFEPFQEGDTTKGNAENRYTLVLTEELVKKSLGLS